MGNDLNFIEKYLARYKNSLFETDVSSKIIKMKKLLERIILDKRKVIIAGNGGSAAIASHVAVDFTKQGGIRTINFNESDLITCFSNDYGYENWISKSIEFYADDEDLVILISSSGNSQNVINAAKTAKNLGLQVVTFTGFEKNNSLQQQGDLNFWVNSRAYNVVECTHQIWLLMICDLVIGEAEYSA